MKKIIVLLVMMSIIPFVELQAQSCPIPEPLDRAKAVGTYIGSYLENGEMKPLKIKISKNGEALESQIAIGSAGYKTAETLLCPREDLHMKITQNGNELEFRGRPENGKLAGNFFYIDEKNNRVSELYSLTKQ